MTTPTPEAVARAQEACALSRCEVTSHPLGTDTWRLGYWCPCRACQMWLKVALALTEQARAIQRLRRALEEIAVHQGDPLLEAAQMRNAARAAAQGGTP